MILIVICPCLWELQYPTILNPKCSSTCNQSHKSLKSTFKIVKICSSCTMKKQDISRKRVLANYLNKKSNPSLIMIVILFNLLNRKTLIILKQIMIKSPTILNKKLMRRAIWLLDLNMDKIKWQDQTSIHELAIRNNNSNFRILRLSL